MSTGEDLIEPRPLTDADLMAIDRAINTRRPIGWLHAYGLRVRVAELEAEVVALMEDEQEEMLDEFVSRFEESR
jgi:hypothetical protein